MNTLTESEINTLQLCILNMSDSLLPTGIAKMQALHAKLEGMKTPNKVLQTDETLCTCKDDAFINDETPGCCGNCGKPFHR